MPAFPPSARAFLFLAAFAAAPSSAGGFSRAEWIDAGRPGSAVWIRNGWNRPISLDALFVRTLGFQGFREVAFNAGPRRYHFIVKGNPRGHWARLAPVERGRIQVRARDSLMLSGFECGARLRGGQDAKRASEEFVLDLKVADSRGDTSQLKVVQMAPEYRIQDQPGIADSGPDGR
jgi:hypothetical protein